MASKKFDKSNKKMEILRAAAVSFAKNGIAKTKMEDIALTAGVGKGTIYEYFRSKEDIFLAAHEQLHIEIDKKIKIILDYKCDPDKKLKMLVDESLNIFQTKKNKTTIVTTDELAGMMMQFWSEGIREGSDKLIKPCHLKEIQRKYRKVLEGVLKDGIKQGLFKPMDTRLSASVILAILDGIPMQRIIAPNVFGKGKIGKVITDIIMDGIRK